MAKPDQPEGAETPVTAPVVKEPNQTGSIGRRETLLLLILPLLYWWLTATVAIAKGPFHLGWHFDPEYQYLFFGLELAELNLPSNFQHPGVPTVLVSALVILAGWLGLGFVEGWGSIAETAVRHHEGFMYAIAGVFAVLIGVALCFVGRRIYRLTGSLWPALAFQFAPLLSLQAIDKAYRVSPDPAEILVILVLVYVLAPATLGPNPALAARDPRRAVSMGIVLALGIASKYFMFTLAPLVLLLIGWRQWLRVAGMLAASLAVLLIPAYSQFGKLRAFLKDKTAGMGAGDDGAGLLDTAAAYWSQCRAVLDVDALIPWTILVCVAVLVVGFFARGFPDDNGRGGRLRLAALLGGLAIVLHVGFIAFRFRIHYLVPALALCYFVVPHVVELVRVAPWRRALRAIPALVLISGLALSARDMGRDVRNYGISLRRYRAYISEVSQKVAEQPGCMAIGFYRSSVPSFALFFGSSYARTRFATALEKVYPGQMDYNIWGTWVRPWTLENRREDVEKRIAEGACILLRGEPGRSKEILGWQLHRIWPEGDDAGVPESLYRVSLDASNPVLIADPQPMDYAMVFEAEEAESNNLVSTAAGGITTVTASELPASAEFRIRSQRRRQRFVIRVRYASGEERPVTVRVNGKVITTTACRLPTGGFDAEHQMWHDIGLHWLEKGKNVIRFESDGPMPNIDKIAIRRIAPSVLAAADPPASTTPR